MATSRRLCPVTSPTAPDGASGLPCERCGRTPAPPCPGCGLFLCAACRAAPAHRDYHDAVLADRGAGAAGFGAVLAPRSGR